MSLEMLLVLCIVGLALFMIVKRVVSSLKKGQCDCGCGKKCPTKTIH